MCSIKVALPLPLTRHEKGRKFSDFPKGPFIIYGREGAGDFGEGATYFWQVAERGGHLFLASRLEGGPLIFGAKKF